MTSEREKEMISQSRLVNHSKAASLGCTKPDQSVTGIAQLVNLVVKGKAFHSVLPHLVIQF